MNLVGYIGIYIVVWAICLFMVLPFGAHSQIDHGTVVAGSEPGAPAVFRIWKKLLANTVLSVVVVALIYWGASNPVLQRYWH